MKGGVSMNGIASVIRADLLSVGAGKDGKSHGIMGMFKVNGKYFITIFLFLFWTAIEFLFMPMLGVMLDVLFPTLFAMTLFSTENKNHSTRMYSVVPISRKQLVTARFLLVSGLTAVVCIVEHIIMVLAVKLELYAVIMNNASEFAEKMQIFNDFNFLNPFSCNGFMLGIVMGAGSLRAQFRDSSPMDIFSNKKVNKGEMIMGIAVIAIIVGVGGLAVTGVINFEAILAFIAVLFQKLLQPLNGMLFGSIMLIWGIISLIYSYICTLLEYGDKEL